MSEYIALKKRFVYAGDVIAELLKGGMELEAAILFANNLPTADVADVVRCKDCMHRGGALCDRLEAALKLNPETGKMEFRFVDTAKDDGFCDRGERKDGATDGNQENL